MNRESILRWRIKLLTWVFIIGLAVSGATAIPLEPELDVAAKALGVADKSSAEVASGLGHWILKVREGLHETNGKYPFMAYGTD